MYLMIRKKQHIKFKELIIITAENCNLIITILYKEEIHILYNFLVFLSFIQSIIGFIFMTSSVMNFKEPFKKRIIIGILVMIVGISFLSYSLFTKGKDAVESFSAFFILGITLSWFLICSKDSFFISLFSFLSFVNIYISISYISDNLAIYKEGNAFIIQRIIIRMIIYSFLIPFLFKIVRPRFRILVDTLDKEWKSTTLIPLVFLIMQIIILYYPKPYWYWNNHNWYRIIILILYVLFLVIYYNLYIQAKGILERYSLEKKQLLMSQQEKLWESELARQKELIALSSQQRHDMHHHNVVIMELLKNKNIEEIKRYMFSFERALDLNNDIFICSNLIANSLFKFYQNIAEEKNIKTTFNVSIPEDIGIQNIDLTCILGNILENAIEGCLRLSKGEEKEIIVMAKFIDNRLRIQVKNTCIADIAFEGDLPITQKKVGGTGIKSIIYTAEQYDGTAGFSIIDGKFITRLVLNGKNNLKDIKKQLSL